MQYIEAHRVRDDRGIEVAMAAARLGETVAELLVDHGQPTSLELDWRSAPPIEVSEGLVAASKQHAEAQGEALYFAREMAVPHLKIHRRRGQQYNGHYYLPSPASARDDWIITSWSFGLRLPDKDQPLAVETDLPGVRYIYSPRRLGEYDRRLKPVRTLDDVRLVIDTLTKGRGMSGRWGWKVTR